MWSVVIFIILWILEQPLCYHGDIQFDTSTFIQVDDASYIVGYPTVCYNGSLAPICDTADLDTLDLTSICLRAAKTFGNDLLSKVNGLHFV